MGYDPLSLCGTFLVLLLPISVMMMVYSCIAPGFFWILSCGMGEKWKQLQKYVTYINIDVLMNVLKERLPS